MRCTKCGTESTTSRKFCAACGTALSRRCSKCGAENAPSSAFCEDCGTALAAPAAAVAGRSAAVSGGPVPAAPPADIPVAGDQPDSSTTIEGERKTVTALFADIKGSTELMEDLDPEEARAIIDPALTLMMDAVHRYSGYVVQSTGDGIFALFGAPVAHEDHPQRALYAALWMQENLRRYSATLRERGMAPVEIRVGVNTGEVVVRTIRTAQGRAEYTPIGHSTNLASRLQALAATGSIAVTEDTRKFCEGYFTFRSLGLTRVKGVSEAVGVHELTGLGPLRTRLQASARRGLSKFVGRETELAQMRRALERAKGGRGQIVAAVGEPGVGKSRLFYEFQASGHPGCLPLEALAVVHGMASAYLPVIDLLRNYFEIAQDDDERKRREKIAGKVMILDRALEEILPYLFGLLEVAEREDQLARLDPEVRRRRTLDAIKRLLLRESLNQPLILIFEDLHWLDEGSRALLNLLTDSIATARVLIVVNYRPEFTHNWGNKTYYTQLRLDPLGEENGEQLLEALLGDGPDLAPLKRVIIEKTEGNPFFIEEIIQELFEQRTLLRNGSIGLARSLNTIQIPSTVQAVLASRIDRLPAQAKELLQTLAVIGKEFPLKLIREVSAKSDDELARLLADLQMSEFIYEQPAVADVSYVFKHALSQQVAYGSTLLERRKLIHERIARFLEAQFPETVETQPELIAHHYTEAGLKEPAIPYWQRAGELALRRAAIREGIEHLKKGLELLEPTDDSPASKTRRCSLSLLLGRGQWQAGEYVEAQDTLLHAANFARSLESTESLVSAGLELAACTYYSGAQADPALRTLEEALTRLGPEPRHLKARILGGLARVLGLIGERERLQLYAPQAVAMARRYDDPELLSYSLLSQVFTLLEPDQTHQRLTVATEMLKLAKATNDTMRLADGFFWRAQCLLELGDIAAADQEIEAWARVGEEANQPLFLSLVGIVQAMRAHMMGRFDESERLAQRASVIGQGLQGGSAAGILGIQMFALRREQGRLKELEGAIQFFVQQQTLAETWRPGLAVIYSELGHKTKARDLFESLAQHDFVDVPRDSLWMATMTYLADICAFLRDRPRADMLYQILLPFDGRNVVVSNLVVCHGALSRYLGDLATILGRWDDAARHFEDAIAMNARMGALPWLAHTQHRYAGMLTERNQSGDRDKAITLLETALVTARELGMRALEERITDALAQTTTKLH
jgi:class 3 adenylate cyclase/tetratricopeptide (TPR) repeat protein